MRRGLLGIGIALAVLGAILLVAALSGVDGNNVAQNTTIPQWSNFETVTVNSIGSASLTVSWSGGVTTTQVYLATCHNSACSQYSSLATGHGGSGSISASISSGTYRVWENSTSTAPLAGSYTVSGITLLDILAFALLALGGVLVVVGLLLKAKPKVVYQEEEDKDLFKVGSSLPGAPEVTATPARGPTPPPKPVVEYRPERPEPPRYMKESEPYTPSGPSPNAPGERPMRVCANCGTTNEPWLTNCRSCKRPLSTTG
jgi:hypothetical protein